ncbi:MULTISPECIES: IclR family transcriptional regulator [Bacillus cereus group]|uniref:IclR family transcriptional regulator n=1 Tax=Bacillus thuringiensis serovar mexicanensis TaxID=180868 RepID=A0A242W102_BACTU|nr:MULTISPECIES: IclR family transcriptional regulator [Bacillus cereus group]EEM55777.1 Transcriptional regulator, IclR [Bacillus thuringiensis serovar monterrey BGSC 4AJ1]MEB9673823.1 IclR family transcriptional regulator [Bacillus anthracis]OTW44498.1 IclR family transcriptional regulator [Bacillus thuringiensis serovar mexicanensis]OTX10737.1 IclR family transcriptional regulator [Bacillus thuringiensis serovar monterrey]
MTKEKQPYGTVLIKAAKILDFLSESKKPQPLNVIAQETGMTSSTTLKILETLVIIGYAKKYPETKRFGLGTSLIYYANQYIANLDITKITFPYLQKLQSNLDETVHLGILEEDKIFYINKLEPERPIIRMSSRIGMSIPLYCSAMGKAVLAEFSQQDLESYLTRVELNPVNENTIIDPHVLKETLKEIKQIGFAIDDAEYEEEVYCIGVSLTLNGQTYGAFSVSMPKYRVTEDLKKKMIQLILETKQNILNELKQLHVFI